MSMDSQNLWNFQTWRILFCGQFLLAKIFAEIVQPWMAGEKIHFPWASMLQKLDLLQLRLSRLRFLAFATVFRSFLGNFHERQRERGMTSMKQGSNQPDLSPTKLWNLWGGSQAFVGGVPRLKNFNIFWPLVDVEVVFVMSRWWNGEMCGRFGVDEVKESWENEGGKRWFPPRKNILNNWYENFYITINSWCFGSVFSLQ